MNLQSLLGLTIAGVSLVVSIGFFAQRQASIESGPDGFNVPESYFEVMPESSKEAFRTHFRDSNGVETEVHIKYQDDTTAKLRLYPNGDVETEKRYFLDGTLRKEANFDLRGKLLSGFELRDDRTTLWKTIASESDKVVTETYWPGGQPFSRRSFEHESGRVEYTFYRENGVIWQQMVTVGQDVLIELSGFDELGRVRVFLSVIKENVPNPQIQVAHFNEDGTVNFDQRFGYSADYYYDPESGEPNPNPLVIKSVGVYEKEQPIARTYLTPSGRIYMLERYSGDDSIERLHVQMRGNVTQVEKITSSGRTSRFNFEGEFGNVAPLEDRYLVPLPDKDLPYRHFEESEKALAAGQP